MYFGLLNRVILPLGDLILGTSYIRSLRKWRRWQHLSAHELEVLQEKRLREILTYASLRVPYYRSLGIKPLADSSAWLRSFPILTKSIIKENIDLVVVGDRSSLVKESSSGSSGIQGTVYLTRKEASESLAIQTLWWEWAGYRFGHSMLQTGITPNRSKVKRLKDIVLRTKYIPAFSASEEEILSTLRELQLHPRRHFGGYASSLFLYATVAQKHGIQNIHFDSVISWGDKMFPHYRSRIETQFHTRVFDTYGCTEGLMIAAQKDRQDYYVMSPHVYVEFLNDKGEEVAPGELGKVVVTRLDGRAMPLIRYYLGDIAEKAIDTHEVNGKLEFPRIKRIIGRDTDIVRTPGGKFMVVHSFTGIFEHLPEIKQFRVVQNKLTGIDIEYIPDTGFHMGVLQNVRQKINGLLQEDFEVNFIAVDHIPPTPSGKPQIISSNLPKN